MRLCNMLSVRYAKHLENSKKKLLGHNCKIIIRDQVGNYDDDVDHINIEERWDDFDNKDIQMVLDEVLRYKQVAKLEATKGAQYISKYPRSNVGAQGHELDETTLASSATPRNEAKDGGSRKASARRSRRRLPKTYTMLMNGGKGFGTQACKSLAVSNAIELFKLVFLSTAKAPEVANLLAETLRRYSEHDLITAFNYLQERNFMVRGTVISQFVLSQQFLHNISLSPFPVNTGKRAVKMARWLHERENNLLDNGVDLFADLQCGDVLQLCVLMCSEELSMFPCLPDEGVGEIVDLKKRKCDDSGMCSIDVAKRPKLLDTETFSRKEKGFPGIQLSISRNLISRVDSITLSRDENAHSVLCSMSERGTSYMEVTLSSGDAILKTNAASESTWEAMTCYAKHLASSEQEPSPFHPDLFKTVYSAIQKAGDQGLSIEGISQIIDVNGEKSEHIVEVLEAFGRALKVNAYDSVHVVDSLYRSKYLLASKDSHQHGLDIKLPESCTNDGEPLELLQENHEDEGKKSTKETYTEIVDVHTSTDKIPKEVPQPMSEIQKETSTNPVEVNKSTDEVHRVTILNNPEEVAQPTSEIQRNNENETYKKTKVMSDESCKFRVSDSASYRPILPWVNGDGTINEIVYKGLVRRVLGIVMQNPGILEEHLLSHMKVLNPQSCRKLLELMILDSHITVRKMYQSVSNDPPAMLRRLVGCSYKKPKLVCRDHLFANPKSISCL